eukprot:Rhum_TRINITY_DN14164_c36_g1::Rhum_TRINITY_DN14164_c36_g1_i1::g.69207::m.69207
MQHCMRGPVVVLPRTIAAAAAAATRGSSPLLLPRWHSSFSTSTTATASPPPPPSLTPLLRRPSTTTTSSSSFPVSLRQQRRHVFFDTQPEADCDRRLSTLHELDRAVAVRISALLKVSRGVSRRHQPQQAGRIEAQVRELLRERGAALLSHTNAIDVLSRLGDVRGCLECYRHLRGLQAARRVRRLRRETVQHVLHAYTKRAGQAADAQGFLDAALAAGDHVGREAYVELAKVWGRECDLARATAAIDEVRARGWEVGVDGHNALLSACRGMGEAREVLDSMRIAGTEADEETWRLLLRVCQRDGDARTARAIVRRIREGGGQLTLHHYTALLKCYSLARDVKGISDTYDEACRAGVPFDAVAYRTLVAGLLPWATSDGVQDVCRSAVEAALATCTQGEADGLFVSLLEHHAARGDVREACRVAEKVRSPACVEQALVLVQEARVKGEEVRKAQRALEEGRHAALRSLEKAPRMRLRDEEDDGDG